MKSKHQWGATKTDRYFGGHIFQLRACIVCGICQKRTKMNRNYGYNQWDYDVNELSDRVQRNCNLVLVNRVLKE